MSSVRSNLSKKRRRTANFTLKEKMCLVDLVARRRLIVENKKTDTLSSREKDSAWAAIAQEFNSRTDNNRSVQTLKNCWDNIKKRCRKLAADQNAKIVETEDGSAGIECDLLFQKVRDVISISLDGANNANNCDADRVETDHDCSKAADNPIHVRCNSLQSTEQVMPQVGAQNCIKLSPQLLKMPVTFVLDIKKETPDTPNSLPHTANCPPLLNVVASPPPVPSSIASPIPMPSSITSSPSVPSSVTSPPSVPSSVASPTRVPSSLKMKRQRRREHEFSIHQQLVKEKLALTILQRKQAEEEGELKKKLLTIQLENEKTMLEISELELLGKKLTFKRKFNIDI